MGDTAERPAVLDPTAPTVSAPVTPPPPPPPPPPTGHHRGDARPAWLPWLAGVVTTRWRMPGDGSGSTITVTLAEPTTLTEVGIVSGYAKTSDDDGTVHNWYRGNRRVLAVEWSFDDGTVVTQTLAEVRDLQVVDVGGVTTSTVTLRLVSVSAPGTGRSARDYPAISDLSLVGTPAS